MKITLNWLKQCMAFSSSPDELAERSPALGFATEDDAVQIYWD